MGTSTGTFLLMAEGSTSIWIFFASAANASTFPVTRSSNRAPTAIVHPEHAEREWVGFGERPEAVKRRRHGTVEFFGEGDQLLRCVR
jgi:hypothetical protein